MSVKMKTDGQTGSGKTHTMEGNAADRGVSPRAVAELFIILENSKDNCAYVLTFSMLEIYNETILDLLDNSTNKVSERTRENLSGLQMSFHFCCIMKLLLSFY